MKLAFSDMQERSIMPAFLMKHICEICGKEYEERGYDIWHICDSKACFIEKFWREALDEKTVIIDGNCYHIDKNENIDPALKGFGGTKHCIRFFDGHTVVTTNLWHNGKIPKKYNVKDNAEFISVGDEIIKKAVH